MLKILSYAERTSISVLLAFNTVILFITVLLRYFVNASPTWTEEASRFVMIWIVYIGVSQSVEAKSELKIDIISKIFKSPKAERILYLISTSISMVVCASIVFYGFRFTAFLKGVEQRPASFDIPMYLIYGIIPVSALLMMIKYAARMRAVFRNN